MPETPTARLQRLFIRFSMRAEEWQQLSEWNDSAPYAAGKAAAYLEVATALADNLNAMGGRPNA